MQKLRLMIITVLFLLFSTAVYAETVWTDIDKDFQDLKKQIKQFSESLSKAPESQEFQEIEKKLKEFGDKVKSSGLELKLRIHKEILPELKKELTSLKQQLKDLNRESEIQLLDKHADEIEKTK
ncbi:MAG: hypothetical protein HQK77_02345 [Desulfobacterales bacterium]|nr:hypothetical protein [Desulfobacterales bacterium]